MTDNHIEAARPMRVARWRWMLVPMVVVVAGCLPQPTSDMPASFLSQFGAVATFTVQPPPAGSTGQDIVAALRAEAGSPMFAGRAVPVFGVIDCHGVQHCTIDPGNTAARPVWVVLYPDCGAGDPGWAVVDTVKGVDGGYSFDDSCLH